MILFSLPFALGGGIWIVYLLGYNLSVAVNVGFIALSGVAAETGVIMLIYLNHALEERHKLAQMEHRKLTNNDIKLAVIEGSLLRLRPKIMTVCAIIGGLLPIMLSGGTGSEVISHIAAPMIGGMISSTILTLLVIPCLYLVWNQYQNAKK
jgi:Cu(I)/Ag(I) efflux system membrane protein CusA/SilA